MATDATVDTPSDDVVKDAIIDTLVTMGVDMRPNKLRKMVCRQVGGATWTQFSACLEGMIGRGELRVGEKEGGELITLAKSTGLVGGRGEKEEQAEKQKSRTIIIPLAIALHLKRKGRLKQKNLEQTTKTKLSLSGSEIKAKERMDDSVTLKITCNSDAETSADKHLGAASVLVENMVKAYRRHPDHFEAKKSGGSFKEQEEVRKKKEEGAKCRAKRRRKSWGGDSTGESKTQTQDRRMPSIVPTKTRKRRKFY